MRSSLVTYCTGKGEVGGGQNACVKPVPVDTLNSFNQGSVLARVQRLSLRDEERGACGQVIPADPPKRDNSTPNPLSFALQRHPCPSKLCSAA